MTIIHTDLPETVLLEALRAAMVPARPQDDAGLSIREIAVQLYGNDYAGSRDKVGAQLRVGLAEDKIKRGSRQAERVDGRPYSVTVFRATSPSEPERELGDDGTPV